MSNQPNQGKEKVEVINLRYLVDEGRDTCTESFRIVIHDHVEVDAMLAARKESFSIVPATYAKNMLSNFVSNS